MESPHLPDVYISSAYCYWRPRISSRHIEECRGNSKNSTSMIAGCIFTVWRCWPQKPMHANWLTKKVQRQIMPVDWLQKSKTEVIYRSTSWPVNPENTQKSWNVKTDFVFHKQTEQRLAPSSVDVRLTTSKPGRWQQGAVVVVACQSWRGFDMARQ